MHCVIWLLILPVKPCNRPVPSCSNALNIWRGAGLVPLDLATEEKRTTRTIVVMKKWRKSMRRVLFLKNIATATAAEAAATVVCLWFLSPWNTTLHAHTHTIHVLTVCRVLQMLRLTPTRRMWHIHTRRQVQVTHRWPGKKREQHCFWWDWTTPHSQRVLFNIGVFGLHLGTYEHRSR